MKTIPSIEHKPVSEDYISTDRLSKEIQENHVIIPTNTIQPFRRGKGTVYASTRKLGLWLMKNGVQRFEDARTKDIINVLTTTTLTGVCMEKDEKKEEVVPKPYIIATIILILGYYLAATWAAEQQSPWPLICVISIGIPLHALLILVFFIRRRRVQRRSATTLKK